MAYAGLPEGATVYEGLPEGAEVVNEPANLKLADPSVQNLKGTSVHTGKPLSGTELGSPDSAGGIVGLAEAPIIMAAGFPTFVVSSIDVPLRAALNTFKGVDKPVEQAVADTKAALEKFTYEPKTKQGGKAAEGLTIGMLAYFAPALLPFLGVSKALDTETAKKEIPNETRLGLIAVCDLLMLGAGSKAGKAKETAGPANVKLEETTFYKTKQAISEKLNFVRDRLERVTAGDLSGTKAGELKESLAKELRDLADRTSKDLMPAEAQSRGLAKDAERGRQQGEFASERLKDKLSGDIGKKASDTYKGFEDWTPEQLESFRAKHAKLKEAI